MCCIHFLHTFFPGILDFSEDSEPCMMFLSSLLILSEDHESIFRMHIHFSGFKNCTRVIENIVVEKAQTSFSRNQTIWEWCLFVLTVGIFKKLCSEHDISTGVALNHFPSVQKRLHPYLCFFFKLLMSALEPNMLFNPVQLWVNRFVWNHNCDMVQMWIHGLGSFSYSENELWHFYDSSQHYILFMWKQGET